jgi:hypothetical protein
MAWSATTLAWGVHEYWDSWQKAGELNNALDSIKWVTDYLIKCHPDKDTYYVQVRVLRWWWWYWWCWCWVLMNGMVTDSSAEWVDG